MTHMNNELRDDLISAALDGERVDVNALRRALQTADACQTLAAFVILRAATAADPILPTRRVAEVVSVAGHARPWWSAPSRLRPAWAASTALLALVAAFWFGTTLRGPVITLRLAAPPAAPATVSAPPTIEATASTVPGNHRAPTSGPAAGPSPVRALLQPPTPTRALSFVPGVDWTSTSQ